MVEAKGSTEQPAGELIVMNRTGSLVVQDNKGRDRERYPIVYGARHVQESDRVRAGEPLMDGPRRDRVVARGIPHP